MNRRMKFELSGAKKLLSVTLFIAFATTTMAGVADIRTPRGSLVLDCYYTNEEFQ